MDTTDFSPAIADYIKRDDGGQPYLAGSKCTVCGHHFVGERDVCAKCYSRDKMQATRLAEQGTVYTWTIVHRSFPGVETPFIDVIVDLADGSHLKGALQGVPATPEAVGFDMPVRVVFSDVVPPGQETQYLAFHFEPA